MSASSLQIVNQVKLGESPDYIRYVGNTHELWIAEPDGNQIEIYTVEEKPKLKSTLPVEEGPESLVIDSVRGKAYGHSKEKNIAIIDLISHQIETISNGCPNT